MSATEAWQKYWNLYQLAVRADAAFTTEVVRQLGKKRAGDMRYVSSAFDYATNCAAWTKQDMDRKCADALHVAREFPIVHSFLNVSSHDR